GLFYPFQKAIQKFAGVDYPTFRKQAFEYYKNMAGNTVKNAPASQENIKEITRINNKYVTSYYYPQSMGDNSLVYLKADLRHRPAFFIRTSSGERLLKIRSISIDEQFSYRNGKIVYAAYETDPRWSWRDYSVIKMLDVNTHKETTLTKKTKYFTPDISPDGSKIAAVMQVPGGKCELHILNASDGKMITAIRSAEIATFTDPKFVDDHSLVTAVRLQDGEMALAMANIETGSTIRLTTPSFNIVGFPGVDEGVIYFTATYGGNDDLFALRMDDHKIYRVTQGPLGNYFVNAAEGKISWSAFTADGYQLRQIDKKDIKWQEIGMAEATALKSRFPVSHTNEFSDILLNKVQNRHFPVSKYKKVTGLLNFHSWRPYYSDPIFTYSLYGENVLNTLETELYYLYNRDEKTSAVGFSTVYGGCYPYINAGSEYTFNRESMIGSRVRQWDQLDLRAGLNIPLFMTKGASIMQFNAGTNYYYRSEFNKGFYKDSLGTTHFSYLLHYLSWNHHAQPSVQDIYPKLGYHFSLNYRYAITNIKSWQWLANAGIYLPGLAANHNISFTWDFQETDTVRVAFGNRFPYARGYHPAYFARMWGFAANYHFPLILPDWGFGNMVYLHRIRANAFYDLTRVYSKNKAVSKDQRAVGGEIYIDTNWWNQYPLTFGFRVSYLLDKDFFTPGRSTVFEFILPVSIIPR
ncbi:MAG TPA: hypothetical protein VLJ68_04655, partial [Chitinophagaceae bacterium]|nr:hypothetical protein [Chitinophagaceae bacterium]